MRLCMRKTILLVRIHILSKAYISSFQWEAVHMIPKVLRTVSDGALTRVVLHSQTSLSLQRTNPHKPTDNIRPIRVIAVSRNHANTRSQSENLKKLWSRRSCPLSTLTPPEPNDRSRFVLSMYYLIKSLCGNFDFAKTTVLMPSFSLEVLFVCFRSQSSNMLFKIVPFGRKFEHVSWNCDGKWFQVAEKPHHANSPNDE